MAHEEIYQPVPCSHWPEDLLQAVGTTYRETRGQGEDASVSLSLAVGAYIAAGGLAASAPGAVRGMLASLSAERGDWLWGPAQEWADRRAPAVPEPAWAEAEAAQ